MYAPPSLSRARQAGYGGFFPVYVKCTGDTGAVINLVNSVTGTSTQFFTVSAGSACLTTGLSVFSLQNAGQLTTVEEPALANETTAVTLTLTRSGSLTYAASVEVATVDLAAVKVGGTFFFF